MFTFKMLKTNVFATLITKTYPIYFLSSCSKHTLPDLPYAYNALEPTISSEIMELHHKKHHAAYVNNLNIAQEKLDEAIHKNDANQIITLQV